MVLVHNNKGCHSKRHIVQTTIPFFFAVPLVTFNEHREIQTTYIYMDPDKHVEAWHLGHERRNHEVLNTKKKNKIEPNSKQKSLCKKKIGVAGRGVGYRAKRKKEAKHQVDNLF